MIELHEKDTQGNKLRPKQHYGAHRSTTNIKNRTDPTEDGVMA
jgi:hypothetical protein